MDNRVHVDYAGLCKAYEALYRDGRPKSLGVGKGGACATFDSHALAALADQLHAIAHNDYELAMWQRRVWLHRHGRDGEVYDGHDAVQWKAQMQGKGGVSIPQDSRFRPASPVAQPIESARCLSEHQTDKTGGVLALGNDRVGGG